MEVYFMNLVFLVKINQNNSNKIVFHWIYFTFHKQIRLVLCSINNYYKNK